MKNPFENNNLLKTPIKKPVKNLGKELSTETVSAKKGLFENKTLNEQGLERRNEIIEKGEAERASTITNSIIKKSQALFKNKSFQKILNHTPYVGDLIMTAKMIRGKEGNHKLTGREYLFYSASILTSAISFYYLIQGDKASAGFSLSISEGVSYVDTAIGVMKDVATKIMASDSKLSGMLSAISNSFSNGKSALENIGVSVANTLNTLEKSFAPNYALNYANNE